MWLCVDTTSTSSEVLRVVSEASQMLHSRVCNQQSASRRLAVLTGQRRQQKGRARLSSCFIWQSSRKNAPKAVATDAGDTNCPWPQEARPPKRCRRERGALRHWEAGKRFGVALAQISRAAVGGPGARTTRQTNL